MTFVAPTADERQRYREAGDPPADAAVAAAVAAEGEEVLGPLLVGLPDPGGDAASLPSALRDFLAAPLAPPPWLDRDAQEAAARLFARCAVETLVALFLGSLPRLFCNPSIARTFATSRLFRPGALARMVPHVAGIVVAAMGRPGGLELVPKGPGVVAFERLRLHHAVIRRAMRRPGSGWSQDWGTPVNQAELALTIASIACFDAEGLAILGAPLSPDERETTVQAWRLIGFLLGVDERLLPERYADVEALLEIFGEGSPTDDSRELVTALADQVGDALPGLLRQFPHLLMRPLLGDELCRALRLAEPRGLLAAGLGALGLLVGRRRALRFAAGPGCRLFVRAFALRHRRHRHGTLRPLFDLADRYL